jgi:tRNA-splicing ligase RtcB
LGTLGSGNHFVEVGYVAEVYDEGAARTLGLAKDQVTVIVHTGSRGLGHQVCDDSIRVMLQAAQKYGIELPDKQLCCAPLRSQEGKEYLAAMACAANFAFANRQIITHWVRETFEQVLRAGPSTLRLDLIYDVCHNIAKVENHTVEGRQQRLCVHRKGATRAFPPHHPDVPPAYQEIGQPVLIPGDMGRCSYVLVGTQGAFEETFGSTCHGAGRVMSRHQAKKSARGRAIAKELEAKGIYVRAASMGTIVEEIPEAYKDVSDVVDVVHGAGIGKKVVQLKPIGVIKG